MLVHFRLNLGSIDARRLHLDREKCTEGATADVSEEVAQELQRLWVAEIIEDIKAVPPEPMKGVKGKKKQANA